MCEKMKDFTCCATRGSNPFKRVCPSYYMYLRLSIVYYIRSPSASSGRMKQVGILCK